MIHDMFVMCQNCGSDDIVKQGFTKTKIKKQLFKCNSCDNKFVLDYDKDNPFNFYKAFDFISGKTYLIGKHKTKQDAIKYARNQGMIVIKQTVVGMTKEQYDYLSK